MTRQNLLTIALLVSVATNLFFVGGISYRLARVAEERPAQPLPPQVGWMIRELNDGRRQELLALVRQDQPQVRRLRRAMFETQRRIQQLIQAEEFSPQETLSALTQLRQLADRYQATTHQQMIRVLAQLSPEERRRALDFMRRRGQRGDGPRPDGGNDRPLPSPSAQDDN